MEDNTYQKFMHVSWDEFHRMCKALSWRINSVENNQKDGFCGLAAVTRGGLVPAAIVARELNLRHVETICISSYDVTNLRKSEILKAAEIANDGAGWLIVDDLVDTGRTAKIIRQLYPKAHFATVYAKPEGRPFVDTFMAEFSQDTWIHMPWDIEQHLPYVKPISEMNPKD